MSLPKIVGIDGFFIPQSGRLWNLLYCVVDTYYSIENGYSTIAIVEQTGRK